MNCCCMVFTPQTNTRALLKNKAGKRPLVNLKSRGRKKWAQLYILFSKLMKLKLCKVLQRLQAYSITRRGEKQSTLLPVLIKAARTTKKRMDSFMADEESYLMPRWFVQLIISLELLVCSRKWMPWNVV